MIWYLHALWLHKPRCTISTTRGHLVMSKISLTEEIRPKRSQATSLSLTFKCSYIAR